MWKKDKSTDVFVWNVCMLVTLLVLCHQGPACTKEVQK